MLEQIPCADTEVLSRDLLREGRHLPTLILLARRGRRKTVLAACYERAEGTQVGLPQTSLWDQEEAAKIQDCVEYKLFQHGIRRATIRSVSALGWYSLAPQRRGRLRQEGFEGRALIPLAITLDTRAEILHEVIRREGLVSKFIDPYGARAALEKTNSTIYSETSRAALQDEFKM